MPRALVPFYLAVQGIAVAGWWLALFARPTTRSLFFPEGALSPALRSFVIPDLVVIGAGSLLAAWLVRRQASLARSVLLVVAGGVAYATLFTLAWVGTTGAPWLSAALMLLAAGGTLLCVGALG